MNAATDRYQRLDLQLPRKKSKTGGRQQPHIFRALALYSALCVFLAVPAHGQQQPTSTPPDGNAPNQPADSSQSNSDTRQKPLPALRGLFVGADIETDNSGTAVPDTHALTGGETIGPGDLQRPRDVLDFAGHIGETADTGIVPGYVTSVTQLGGSVAFDQTWSRFHTTIVYDGAALLYNPHKIANQQSHTLGVSQDIEWQRWILRLRDDFVASPQATFSGFDTGGFGSGEVGMLATILPGLGPDETILTAYAMRVNEVGLAEVDYRLSRRSEITFAGSYGVLHFLSPGYIDSYEANGRAGYNYQLDPKDTIGFLYDYSLVGYSGLSEKVDSNLGQVTFGRKVLGRLSVSVTAGPQRIGLDNYGSTAQSQWAWSASAAATYVQRRTNYSVTFTRGLMAGAGVLLGAYGDTIIGGVTRQLSRTWTVAGTAGYARNSNVAAMDGANLFSNYYGTASLAHDLSRRLVVTLNYGFQKQDTAGICPVANCGFVGLRQIGGVTLDWHTQRIALN